MSDNESVSSHGSYVDYLRTLEGRNQEAKRAAREKRQEEAAKLDQVRAHRREAAEQRMKARADAKAEQTQSHLKNSKDAQPSVAEAAKNGKMSDLKEKEEKSPNLNVAPQPRNPSNTGPCVRVGVAAMLRRNGRLCIGTRLASHGRGLQALPGGHLEMGESVIECALREVEEETGLVMQNPVLGPVTNDIWRAEKASDGSAASVSPQPELEGGVVKHYVTFFVIGDSPEGEGEAVAMEPDKCQGWEWRTWDAIKSHPRNTVFLPILSLIDQWPGFDPFSPASLGAIDSWKMAP
uniref:Nudix hydrolase domain-containing protein n=1 Tax=Chromera velia CCMP2878 TaxID=1169474 RepID=A0A0G4I8R8_9ALVE|mmetsp:Transcript_11129/g.21501  ORF Transcript_11129/g.21501 Transcript_11129/m.21501 type:complete len:293 (+) Transcript_11129:328-1206(+)|eukprot:Cvel_12037.t1-p1 / transcript=Cvel_12037.t1 / gene=Cvel_12037 / organism=Chromera_velia_CCMP2878 / gene_product=Nudix hydrolase 1, putative / transcript_product=Nudix hydrolase 1, putative / location=Cvel_scaffold773:41800-43301(-) / protein_length=292 / sequence_SO=supercontig / SO=protein_coding / is_pseudo=false